MCLWLHTHHTNLPAPIHTLPPHFLLQDLDSGVRVGDVYALMIEYWYEQRNMQEAYKLVEQMRGRNIIISPYLDQRMVEDIYKV